MRLSKLADVYNTIAASKSESKRRSSLIDLFQQSDDETLRAIAHFTAGELVDPRQSDALGIGPAMVRDALARLSGKSAAAIEEEVKKRGDMSEVAARVASGDGTLTVSELWRRINRMVSRNENRRQVLDYIYAHTDSSGARYVTRMLLNQMRIGVGLGAILRAIAEAFDVDEQSVQRLYALSNDLGLTAATARTGARSLARTGLTLFRPYQFMNAQKVGALEEVFDLHKGKRIIFEAKYDGARLQVHIGKGSPLSVSLYSRRLNDVTESLPDVVRAIQEAWKGGDAILEGEAVAYDSTLMQKQPFQMVLTRLGRKYDVEETAHEIPIVLYLFDILHYNNHDLIRVPESERRVKLTQAFRAGDRVRMAEAVVTHRFEDAEAFFRDAIVQGHEGLVAKDPDAPYIPGKRIDYWLKLKPAFETLDVIVVGGTWGSGRRRGMLSSLDIAVVDGGDYLTVGKVGTGFSEETLHEITGKLEPLIIASQGRSASIEPSMVIEVDFQGIQKTKAYTSGFALRIPRFKRERSDKSIREADSLDRVERLYRESGEG